MEINKSIANAIYEYVFNTARICRDIDGSFQCHCSVEWVKKYMRDNWWYKSLKFLIWNESNWNKISEKLINDNKKFSSNVIKDLITDISDFSVNGHSIKKFKDYYIDPYLKSRKVSEKAIQQFGLYWEKIT